MAHDQHDEEYIRSHPWEYPSDEPRCSDSTAAPKHAPAPNVFRGTFPTGADRRPNTRGRGRYR